MEQSVTSKSISAEQSNDPFAKFRAITIALIAVNVLVYLAMLASGISFAGPTPRQALVWGANYGPLTAGYDQWWRLLTSCFVHFGIAHIAMNMFVLYQVGPFIEVTFGRARYLILYFLAGLSGSLVSLWISPQFVSAGASGAIFGLYGAVFAFLLLERKELVPGYVSGLAKSAGIFVIYNLINSTISRTTSLSAHLGGLVGGFLLGLLLLPSRNTSW